MRRRPHDHLLARPDQPVALLGVLSLRFHWRSTVASSGSCPGQSHGPWGRSQYRATGPGCLCAEVLRNGRASRTDGAIPYGQGMAKAARILAALKRDGWIETRRSGSHRVLVKGDQQRIWAYHDGVDLGGPALARIARDYGYTVDELRKL